MAFDISKFEHLYDFEHEVDSVGTLHCRSLNGEQERELTKVAKDDNVGSESLARQLLAHVARAVSPERADGRPDTADAQLPAEILARVTGTELESFCERFLSKNTWLSNTHDGEDLQRVENENSLDLVGQCVAKTDALSCRPLPRATVMSFRAAHNGAQRVDLNWPAAARWDFAVRPRVCPLLGWPIRRRPGQGRGLDAPGHPIASGDEQKVRTALMWLEQVAQIRGTFEEAVTRGRELVLSQ